MVIETTIRKECRGETQYSSYERMKDFGMSETYTGMQTRAAKIARIVEAHSSWYELPIFENMGAE